MSSSQKLNLIQKIYNIDKMFLSVPKYFFNKTHFKKHLDIYLVSLYYSSQFSYLNVNFKLANILET